MSSNQASASTSEGWGRSRMQIPSLVHGVGTTDMDMHGNAGGREEKSSSDGFPSPTQIDPPADTSSGNPQAQVPGTRHFCTYVHPNTNKPCTNWVRGFSSHSDLLRHQMNIHGQEEIRLLKSGQLALEKSVIINSRERLEYLEQQYALTRFCEECGTEFTSGRHDALTRHVSKGACKRKLEARAKST